MKNILFLCTGNYYRSRFCEEFFNFYAQQHQLSWRADSKGIMREFEGNGNVGPIAKHTLDELAKLGIVPSGHTRMPAYVFENHFDEFDRVIAVSHDEHAPMLAEIWDMDAKSVEYFDVEDLHIESFTSALPKLTVHMTRLMAEYGIEI